MGLIRWFNSMGLIRRYQRTSWLCRGALLLVWLGVLLASPLPLYAHAGAPPAPHDLWERWQMAWSLLLALLLTVGLYQRGVRTVWQRAGVGRGVSRRQVGYFSAGMVVLAIALLSPIDTISSALFFVHMIQHVLLIDVAALLLILGTPPALPLWCLPLSWRRDVVQWWHRQRSLRWIVGVLAHPLVIWAGFGVTLWLWHAPLLYQAALRNEWIHRLEHGTFLGTALLFWWLIIWRQHSRLRTEQALLLLFTTALHSGLLGALLTFASRPLYTDYLMTAPLWGVNALTDQQLAGTVMWIPVGFVYLGTIVVIMQQWLKQQERDQQQLRYDASSFKNVRSYGR